MTKVGPFPVRRHRCRRNCPLHALARTHARIHTRAHTHTCMHTRLQALSTLLTSGATIVTDDKEKKPFTGGGAKGAFGVPLLAWAPPMLQTVTNSIEKTCHFVASAQNPLRMMTM